MKKIFTASISIFLFALFVFSCLVIPSQSRAANGWTEQLNSGYRNWASLTTSSDGSKVIGLDYNNYIWTSSDYGVTWTQRTSDVGRAWYSVTSSASGQYAAAIVYGGNVWTSSDYGATWTAVANTANASARNWYSIDSSSDGRYLAAVVKLGNIWTSSDYGVTWTNVNNAGMLSWRAITSSANGQNLAAIVRNGNVWTSSNYGANWTERVIAGSASTYFFSITSSDLGDKLAIADNNRDGYIYTSSDYGVTWTPKFNKVLPLSNQKWYSVYYSSDGTKIIAAMYNDNLYESLDSGETWSAVTGTGTSRRWQPVVYSGDGTKIYAGLNGGYSYSYGEITGSPIITSTAVSVNSTEATINAKTNTLSTARIFEYGLTSSYGETIASFSVLNLETFSSTPSSLLLNTNYHYRIKATNDFGSNYSSDAVFSILPFTQRTTDTTRVWKSIAASSDGKYLAAVVNGGYIYTSTDYGANWVQKTSDTTRNWIEITSSSDGKYLAAAVSGGYIYTSTDYGANWIQKTSDATRNWKSITSSSDGKYLAAAVNGGYIYTSDNYGDTWSVRVSDTTRTWQAITSSDTGEKLAAVLASTNVVYASSDYGVTWTGTTGIGLISALTANDINISGNGSKLVIGDNNGYVFTSLDALNWTQQTAAGSRYWQSIDSSTDGSKIVAVNNSGYLYISFDGGVSWVEQTSIPASAWQSVVISSDASVITAVANPGYIYAYTPSAPTVSTGAASSVSTYAVTLNGDILNTGGANPNSRGIEYGLDTNYGQTINTDGSFSINSFSSQISALSCGTVYHYRAYATNNFGTSYGSDQTFKTGDCPFAPFVLPGGVGAGLNDESVAMDDTRDIDEINVGGINLLIYINAQANFKTPESSKNWALGSHSLKIVDFDLLNNIIKINISSKEQAVILEKGASQEVDLDGDSINDLKLTFANIYVNRAEITIKPLKKEVAITPVKPAVAEGGFVTATPVVTPVITTTTVANKSFVFSKNLKSGNINLDVKELQKFLNSKGYIVSKSGAGAKGLETITFGPATKAALIKFQKANKINPASGLFGPLTRKLINSAK
jgi:hypothetical protein